MKKHEADLSSELAMVVRIAKHQQADKARHVSNRQENKGITIKP